MFSDPFEVFDDTRLTSFCTTALTLTVVIGVVFWVCDIPLRDTELAPFGIVSYEFVGDAITAQKLIASWDPRSVLIAAFVLGLDYLFLFAYSLTLAGLLSRLVRGRDEQVRRLIHFLCWAMFAAAVADAIENFALFQMLRGMVQSNYANLAYWCATFKFFWVVVGIVGIVGLGAWRLARPVAATTDATDA